MRVNKTNEVQKKGGIISKKEGERGKKKKYIVQKFECLQNKEGICSIFLLCEGLWSRYLLESSL